jgi:hypothetical protein
MTRDKLQYVLIKANERGVDVEDAVVFYKQLAAKLMSATNARIAHRLIEMLDWIGLGGCRDEGEKDGR